MDFTFESSGRSIEVPYLDLQRTIIDLERRHLPPPAGTYQLPTFAFLRAVATWLSGLGAGDVGTAEAWQIWLALSEFDRAARHATTAHATIAFWYHLDADHLSEVSQAGLLANLPRMLAQDQIRRRDYDPCDYEGIYRLFKLAYDDESLARKQQTAAFQRYVDKCTKART